MEGKDKKVKVAPKKVASKAKKPKKAPSAKKQAVEKKGKPVAAKKTEAAATKKAAGKKKAADKKEKKMTVQQRISLLFQARPRNFGIGQDLRPFKTFAFHPQKKKKFPPLLSFSLTKILFLPFFRDLTHFVKWPRYIRISRQKKILMDRLKTPPPINLFRHSLDKATAVSLFKFLHEMRPEEEQARKKRRIEGAKYIARAVAGKGKGRKQKTKDGKPRVVSFSFLLCGGKKKSNSSHTFHHR